MASITTYDEQLKTFQHYQKYPEMLPFIGAKYGSTKNRLFVISESHYLSKGAPALTNWYEGNSELTPAEKENIHSRHLVGAHKHNSKLPFKPLSDAAANAGFKAENNASFFDYVTWFNFFQRPANGLGVSIKAGAKDIEIAEAAFLHNYDVLKPTHVIFASSKAWNSSRNLRRNFIDKSVVFDYVPHPNCAWWNKKAYEGKTGKEKFQKFVADHLLLLEA